MRLLMNHRLSGIMEVRPGTEERGIRLQQPDDDIHLYSNTAIALGRWQRRKGCNEQQPGGACCGRKRQPQLSRQPSEAISLAKTWSSSSNMPLSWLPPSRSRCHHLLHRLPYACLVWSLSPPPPPPSLGPPHSCKCPSPSPSLGMLPSSLFLLRGTSHFVIEQTKSFLGAQGS